jgi:hypothetical protein
MNFKIAIPLFKLEDEKSARTSVPVFDKKSNE